MTLAIPFGTRPRTCTLCALAGWLAVLHGWDLGGRVQVLRRLRTGPLPASWHICLSVPA